MKNSIKQVLAAYILFKIYQFYVVYANDSSVYDKIGFTIGLFVPIILIYFSFKDYVVFKWLISINIIIAGVTTLLPGIFAITWGNNPWLKVFAIIFGLYLMYGSYLLFSKTIKKEKFA